MVIYQIPHTAKLLTPTARAVAVFNAITPGKYEWNVKGLLIQNTQPNTVYLIDRLTWSASIAGEYWQQSINPTLGTPKISLRQKNGGNLIYSGPYSLAIYGNETEYNAWFRSDKNDDGITVDISGLINQIAETVGISDIAINISLSIYAIDSTEFSRAAREPLSHNSGQQIRGGI